jgi:anti-anti-sigma factor
MNYQQIELGNGKRRVILEGDFDAVALSDGELRPWLESLAEEASGDIYLDLSGVSFLDSSGIGAMVFLFKRLKARNLALEIVQPLGQPRQLLEMLRIHEAIPVQLVA